jgi:hypothetical protein
MNNIIERAKMELIDKGFSQKIADKYTNLQLFTTAFTPITSTKRIIPRMRWLELIYALPVVLRREILNSFKRTKNVFASAKQIWNIFVQLEFPRSRSEYVTTRLHRFSREIMKMQVKPVSGIPYPVSSSYVNHVKSRGFYFISAASYNYPASYILPRISDLITHPFRHYSIKPTFFLRHKAVPVKQRGVSSDLQKSDAPYGHLETLQKGQKINPYLKSSTMALAQPLSHETVISRTENELAFQNYPLPVVSHQPSAVSNNNLRTYIPTTTSNFINLSSFNIINKKNEQMQLGAEKAPLYHTYPRIEHVTSTQTEIIKERVIEKEDKPPHATPQLPSVDVNRLTDQVYQLMERKVRIERERGGL